MEQPFLRSYVELLIHTCHRRGIHAMGGMAAQIPIRNNPMANERRWNACARTSFAKSVPATMARGSRIRACADSPQIFDEYMTTPNQIHASEGSGRESPPPNLLEIPQGASLKKDCAGTSTLPSNI